jgi:hypothetical protein
VANARARIEAETSQCGAWWLLSPGSPVTGGGGEIIFNADLLERVLLEEPLIGVIEVKALDLLEVPLGERTARSGIVVDTARRGLL